MSALTQIGNSVGVILPKEMLARMNVGTGGTVYVSESADCVTTIMTLAAGKSSEDERAAWIRAQIERH